MAFNLGAFLSKAMGQKRADGAPLYSQETMQDLVALVLLSGKKPLPKKVPENVATILAAFMARSRLGTVKDGPALKKALGDYFKAHPLPATLTGALQAEFRRAPEGKKRPIRTIRG